MILKARIYPLKFQGDISLFPFRRDAQFDTVADRSPRNFSLPHARLRTAIADRSAEPAQTADFRDLIIDEYHHRDPGNARYYYAVPVTAPLENCRHDDEGDAGTILIFSDISIERAGGLLRVPDCSYLN